MNKEITHQQAMKVAIEAMKDVKKKHSFDANLYRHYGEQNPSAVNAFEKVTKINAAIAYFREEKFVALAQDKCSKCSFDMDLLEKGDRRFLRCCNCGVEKKVEAADG